LRENTEVILLISRIDSDFTTAFSRKKRKQWIRHTLYAYMGVQRLRYGTKAVQWKPDPKYVKALDDRPITID